MPKTKISLFLGSALPQDTDITVQVVQAKSKAEVTAARDGVGLAFLDMLQFNIPSFELASLYDPMELSGGQALLKPGALISIRVLASDGESSPEWKLLATSFLLAGLSGVSERRDADGCRVFEVTKKIMKPVMSAPLKKKMIVVNDLEEEEDACLVDEDDLLKEEGNGILAPPSMAPRTAGDDCSGRKPCDDCTCGRAELEGKGSESKNIKSSGCGSCAKGDAFRCAGCPYLGKPAFKAGEEHLVLDLMDDL